MSWRYYWYASNFSIAIRRAICFLGGHRDRWVDSPIPDGGHACNRCYRHKPMGQGVDYD